MNGRDVLTERLRLEPWHSRHAEALAAMNSDAEVMRFIAPGARIDRRASLELSDRFTAHWSQYGFGLWALRARVSGEFLGFAGLSHPLWFPAYAAEVEVGWRLVRSAWGRGYATEAGRAALGVAFGALELPRVVSLIHRENARSRAVAERLGLTLEREVPHPTEALTVAVYARERPSAARPA